MKTVIIGCGKVGSTLVAHLSAENHDCVVIDKKSDLVNELVNRYNVLGVVGNGASVTVQQEAGVDKADLVIAVTQLDELNMLCCTVAKRLGAKYTVTRVRDNDYSSQVAFLQDKLGFNYAINPDLETAQEIASMLNIPAALPSESFWDSKASLVEIEVEEGSLFDNLLLYDSAKLNVNFLVCAVERGEQVFIPNGSLVIEKGDRIHIIASLSELAKLFKKMGIYKDKPKSVMIIGGSHLSAYLARILSETGISATIVEIDKQRCYTLAEELPKVNIVCGNGNDQNLLEAEGVKRAGALITLTNLDEQNIMLALYGKSINIGKVVCKINNDAYLSLYREIEVDSAVSPKEVTANHILRYVRAMNNSFDIDSVKRLYRIVGNKVDAAEFCIPADNKLVGKCLKDIQCKPDVLIACIQRDGKVFIPNGEDKLAALDNIIVVSKEHFKDVSEITL